MTSRTLVRQVQRTAARAATVLFTLALVTIPFTGPDSASAATVSPAFPRLATWWPDTRAQSVADLSRCDVLALQNHDSSRIAALRAANPGIALLGTSSACELSYSLLGYNDPANVEMRTVSTDWMLTQVGSTLTADIGASATSIPVADVTKFAAGEMVLVDHELMHVSAVGGSSVTVTARGPVTPAASHALGARIASVVRHWPGTILMDLSESCPLRDVGYGPETWAGWEVRRSTAVLDSADWDGLLVDALQSSPGWMVPKGEVRSIDLLRTNTPVTDGYAAFDAAWNVGAIAFGDALRVSAGTRLLVGNGNLRNFNFNGNIFEEYPYADLPLTAWNVVFIGPFAAPRASYPEWCANAAAPSLTLIQVYGVSSDYRLMRYGLCTALLNDGYFSYARSSSVHATSGLSWFDEYDNAGAGRGYLGQPIGSAFRVGSAWRRDFTNGISLVNPTTASVTVQLGGMFRRIKGTQDLTVNSGATVSSVTIPSRDGIILLRVPSLSLTAATTTLTYGDPCTITVGVAPASGAVVRVERRTVGTSGWTATAMPSLDASGHATLVRFPRANTEYRAVLVGNGVVSRTLTVRVKPLLTIRASASTVERSHNLTLSGSITHTGRVPLLLQRRVGTSWRTVRRLTASTSGRYSTAVSSATRGTFSYRVYAAADASHLSAVSTAVSVRVR